MIVSDFICKRRNSFVISVRYHYFENIIRNETIKNNVSTLRMIILLVKHYNTPPLSDVSYVSLENKSDEEIGRDGRLIINIVSTKAAKVAKFTSEKEKKERAQLREEITNVINIVKEEIKLANIYLCYQ
ncbi:hypothetical protein RCL_jg17607.t1 [Rhizophagus clarus]|uniref:Uncharacterized protein n=1 Tax=Rhizophagus clarus TaxID=94130 RepID=A0A8H3L8D0_9GLOM|nr:hypothetical protein RCL_jg17607.t1 [Rhizophagus clarus]